jgi:hypothetical protein
MLLRAHAWAIIALALPPALEEPVMSHTPPVDYMGTLIFAVVGQDLEGFIASAVITDEDGDHSQATGALGSFPTEAEARQFAIEYAKAEVARCRLMTLIG